MWWLEWVYCVVRSGWNCFALLTLLCFVIDKKKFAGRPENDR